MSRDIPTNMLVTGGAKGIGRGLALGLAQAGHPIAVVGDSGDESSLVETIVGRGGKAVAISSRLDSLETAQQAFREAAASLGPIHAVIHAQISLEALQPGPFHELDDERFDRQCEREIRAALFTSQAAHALFTAQAGAAPAPASSAEPVKAPSATDPIGRLFIVVPTLALSGAARHAAWSAACEAQRAMVKSAARQWGPQGILVHCIAPALAAFDPASAEAEATGLSSIPLGHLPNTESEIAPMISLLTREGSHGVTGQTVRMDGGVWLAS